MNKKIKWGCIQPLTGGMYLGAEEAIGKPAEWILSYNGLCDIKTDKNGNISSAANEYNLIKYLEKHNRMPKYYQIHNRDMFDSNIDEYNPDIKLNGDSALPDYNNLDIVVAVPVCSGLSMATIAADDTKTSRNNNMLWITNYTLNVIKPQCYIFENAPTLMGHKGDDIREKLEDIALKANYSVLYFKTDTKLHENCQRRPRTFVIFTKHRSDSNLEAPALFNFEDKHINVKDFFRNIPDNLTQNEPVKTSFHNFILIDYIKHKVGDNYKDLIHNSLMRYVEDNGLFDDFMDFCNSSDKYSVADKVGTKKIIDHIKYKRSLGMNYYANDACSFVDEEFPAVIFKSMSNTLHPFKDEMCSIRDYLTLMGHPFDFELYGNEGNIPRIGQNVPVKTAKYIVSEAVRCLNEKKLFNDNTNVIFQDNISKRIIIDYNCTNKSKALF